MIAMIMKNKPQFTQMSFALETGLGFVRSNYHYGWESAVDSKLEYRLFAELRKLHKAISGSFHSLFAWAAGIESGTR